MGENITSLVAERMNAILTELPLKLFIAAVSDRAVRTATRRLDTVSATDLRQKVRCGRFRYEAVHWEHFGLCARDTLVRFDFQLQLSLSTISFTSANHRNRSARDPSTRLPTPAICVREDFHTLT